MEKLLKNLKLRGFEPYYVESSEEAKKLISEIIPAGSSIGFGGSVTVTEMGLLPYLAERGYVLYHRSMPKYTAEEIYSLNHTADWFCSSTNALCESGDLVNIDGRANRVAEMLYGPKNILIVCGVNKIVKTIDEGIFRTRNIASPKNCVKLDKKTPCAVTGKCMNCNSPDTICKATVIQHHPTSGKRVCIIIINENLGF